MKIAFVAAFLTLSAAGASGARPALAAPQKAKAGEKAGDKAAAGEVTLKGTMVCGKCSLKESDKCQNVLKVTESGKEVKYFLADNDVAQKNHGPVCGGTSPATVKGKVSSEGAKKVLAASEIKYE
jgi:hypothetical protein